MITIPYQLTEPDAKAGVAREADIDVCNSYGLVVSSNAALVQRVTEYLAQTDELAIQGIAGVSNAEVIRKLYDFIKTGNGLRFLIIDQESTQLEPVTLARSLRADPLFSPLYLLLITPRHTPAFEQKLVHAGFDDIIQQPITQTSLVQRFAKYRTRNALSTPGGIRPAAAGVRSLVLVVEDYENNQHVALAHLKKLGYAAHVVENGQAAVDAIVALGDNYQLILMDWQMPIMDGLAATKAIRQMEPQGYHIPIVGMTASAVKGDRERCLEAGMDDYLSKPIRREDLARTLGRWIPSSSGDD